ncbi:hypothetical protein KIW84_073815 [Lathyrus oleraceus]|uniref:Transposase (putative) gypsy type domain-containing protein n=1 Tax=Pisum sativum TaxID=3888 RepID=A0A9D4ZXU7_PEA|nr:hypothetical protein KIW84_073815 [Pisum sativum]
MGYPSVSYHGSVEGSRERVVGGFYASYDGVSQENVYNLLFFHVASGRGNFPAFDDIPPVMARNTKFVHVREITFLYSTEDMFNKFRHNIRFSSIGKEKDVIMEHCSHEEREDMETYDDPSTLFFYFDFPVIYELGVLVPFFYFEEEFLTTLNLAHSQVTPNAWGILRAFQIVCLKLGVHPFVRVFLYLFGITFLPNSGWVTMRPFLGVQFLRPFSRTYKYWKDMFVWVKGRAIHIPSL